MTNELLFIALNPLTQLYYLTDVQGRFISSSTTTLELVEFCKRNDYRYKIVN